MRKANLASKSLKRYHSEQDSRFFRLRTKERLGKLLFSSPEKLSLLARTSPSNLYREFSKTKKNGKGSRKVSAPRKDLKQVQSRIANLLMRINPPDWLYSPVKGRSYVDNARPHAGANAVRLLDIEDFFPSCTGNKVIWFFKQRMECSPDVSAILKGIVAKDDALPQGSPCSPILAYLCYADMWEEIELVVQQAGCSLSVYADDLTISGPKVPELAIWEIKKILKKHGHSYHCGKERSKWKKPAEVTGVIVHHNGVLLVPNRQHREVSRIRSQLKKKCGKEQRETLQAQLHGRVSQIRQITNVNTFNVTK